MSIKKHIPNIITLLNLFSGCVALIFVTQLNFEMAFYAVCVGIFFDFFDGFFARLFKVSSPLGLQLDSLADMVTSGLIPGFAMFAMLQMCVSNLPFSNFLPYLGFVITLGSCYRLANFNIDTRQTDSFIGLPTPANALFILSLPLVLQHSNIDFIKSSLSNSSVLLTITFLSALILNAEIPLFSLKIKKMNVKDNLLQITFLSVALLLLFVLRFLAIPLIIMTYIFLSIVKNSLSKN
jgi:CDP-diacylglycerol--serine O-phosphatidyltransferase